MEQHYQAIVVGCGGVGSAALYHLAQCGIRVLGIDRFGAAHDRGSSHGHTRVIRMAYYEHPDYVPLLQRAYQLWRDLERAGGSTLFHAVGVLQTGAADGEVVPGVLRSAEQYDLPVERWTRAQAERKYPVFHIPLEFEIVFEQNAGYLLVEDCVRIHLALAQSRGADWLAPCVVQQLVSEDRVVRVITDQGTFTCDHVVVGGGPWASELLRDAHLPLHVRRKPLHWFRTEEPGYLPDRCPVFVFEVEEKFFYGFPRHAGGDVKIAQHFGGRLVTDPTHISRDVDVEEQAEVVGFASRYLRGIEVPPTHHAVCMYTMTPDQHFIIDKHPADPRIVFACGLSGHGFKFTSVLGEILAELVVNGSTEAPITFLRANR